MMLLGQLQVFAVCLVLFVTTQDIEGSSLTSCRYKPYVYKTCYGSSSYCCPSISYSRSYYGTTFSTCCPYNSFQSNTRYCTNRYAARLYCNAKSMHCCPRQYYMSGSFRRGCCYVATTSTTTAKKCQYAPSTVRTCYGISSYCCPYKSYAQSYFLSTFSSCCGRYDHIYGTVRRCSNKYENYWCRSPSSKCCASKTYISGSWQSGCCRSTTSYSKSSYPSTPPDGDSDSSRYSGPNVGAIVGGGVGAIILVVIIATVVGVTYSRRNARRDTGMAGGTTQGPIQGYPQFNAQPVGSMPYPGYGPQPGPYVIQGAYLAPGAVSYHPTAPVPVGLHAPTGRAPFNAPPMMATPASASAGSPSASAGAQGGAVGGSTQAQPPPEKSMHAEDPPPAYDNIAFSE